MVVYNISFGFILNGLDMFKKKDERAVAPLTVATATLSGPAFRDSSENIFAKDNIAGLSEEVMNESANSETEEPVVEMKRNRPRQFR